MVKITEGSYKNVPQYSINLKDMEDKEEIIVEKIFASAKGHPGSVRKKDGTPGLCYPCKVKYEDKDVTFWAYEIGEPKYANFEECGGIGDKIKITAREEKVVNQKTKVRTLVTKFTFSKVE